jgi:hypothetical protein
MGEKSRSVVMGNNPKGRIMANGNVIVQSMRVGASNL